MFELRQTIIRRSLNRSNLLLGGERSLVLFTALASFTLIAVSFSFVICLIGISIWFFCLAVLRLMAKSDPLLSSVYMRHIKFLAYYPASARVWRDK